MNKLTFNKFNNLRNEFLKENRLKDHTILNGSNNILISAPHGVPQLRLGKYKVQEIGSLSTAIYLYDQTNCFFIAKTQFNNDDVNFDVECDYKSSIRKLIQTYNIEYILDFHGLASFRDCDINLGINFGNNIKKDIGIFDKLYESLKINGFKVDIDQPFMAGPHTICGSIAKQYKDVWTIQIEINCEITNKKENFDKNQKLLHLLQDWIISIPKKKNY